MSDGALVATGGFVAFVRKQTFKPRRDLDMLFVVVDVQTGALMQSWLVPSIDFAALAGQPNSRGRLRFSASLKPGSLDKWSDFRLTPEQLAPRILGRLSEMSMDGS